MRSTQTLDSGTHASALMLPDAITAAVSAESCGLMTVSTQVSDDSSKSFAMSDSAGAMERVGDDHEALAVEASGFGGREERVQVSADPEEDPRATRPTTANAATMDRMSARPGFFAGALTL